MRKKAKTPTDARLDRIFRKFFGNDRETQKRKIYEAMEALDPDEEVWDREYYRELLSNDLETQNYREHFPTFH